VKNLVCLLRVSTRLVKNLVSADKPLCMRQEGQFTKTLLQKLESTNTTVQVKNAVTA
jgi:hypothetical protein